MRRRTYLAGRPIQKRRAVPGLLFCRKRANCSQRELAAALDISTSAVQAWESKRWKPSAEAVVCMARVLECKEAELFNGGNKR